MQKGRFRLVTAAPEPPKYYGSGCTVSLPGLCVEWPFQGRGVMRRKAEKESRTKESRTKESRTDGNDPNGSASLWHTPTRFLQGSFPSVLLSVGIQSIPQLPDSKELTVGTVELLQRSKLQLAALLANAPLIGESLADQPRKNKQNKSART
jgi:hypothetical protein